MMFAFITVKDKFECSTAGRKVELYFQCSIEQQDQMGQNKCDNYYIEFHEKIRKTEDKLIEDTNHNVKK